MKIHIFELKCNVVFRHTDDVVFDDFPKISGHFPKILRNLSRSVDHNNDAEHLPKITEDCRRFFEEDPKMF